MIAIQRYWLTLCSLAIASHGGYLGKQTFMNLRQAETHYGTQAFSAASFKRGTTPQRARMAVSLIKGKSYLGQTPEQVKEELGDFTGYFFSDKVPAYLIEEGWKDGKDTWQLVFLLDDSGRVNDVRIHKDCCSKK